MKTQTQIDQYEAKIAAAVSTVRQIRAGVYSVPSSRKEVKPHIITVDENGSANFCTCESYEHNGWKRYGHKCYHAQATERWIAAQRPTVRAEKSGYLYYPQHFENGEWLNCVDVLNDSLHTMRFLTEEQALEYVKNEYPDATARREAFQAIKAAEAIVAKPQTDVERYVAQGIDQATAERVANAKGIKSHGNAKAYEPKAFSIYR